mmetsp:Transcript_24981/g.63596  ORF Transcript_24981/g.63596 Transcript_24981/m.63596 type:complete len:116 (-) Transcript_24981:633-980(-)
MTSTTGTSCPAATASGPGDGPGEGTKGTLGTCGDEGGEESMDEMKATEVIAEWRDLDRDTGVDAVDVSHEVADPTPTNGATALWASSGVAPTCPCLSCHRIKHRRMAASFASAVL